MTCGCDESHIEGCPAEAAEREYWAQYYGQTPDRTPQQRRETLRAMAPVGRYPSNGEAT
jgi:hypothetical protein